jgi:hypothetical protein
MAPIGLSFGHHFLAIVSLMTTTGGESGVSVASKNRPAFSGTCIVRKYEASTTLKGPSGRSGRAGTGRSETR